MYGNLDHFLLMVLVMVPASISHSVSPSSPAMDSFELDARSDDAPYSEAEYEWERLSWEERMKDLTGQLTNGGTWEGMQSTVSEFRDY